MSGAFQISLILLGAAITALNALIAYNLSDLKKWLERLNTRFDEHVTSRDLHTDCGRVEHP